MKAFVRIAVVSASALIPLTAGMATVHSEPGDAPRTCAVPADMSGKFMIMYGSTPAMPGTPPGHSMTMVRFTSADQLQYRIASSTTWQDTSYTMRSPEPGVAIIDGMQPAEAGPISYSVTLRCRTDEAGDYSLSAPGAPTPDSDSVAFYRFTNGPQ
ncbi:hypothetical protein [Nocardia sp. NPDC056000]|uniref:hypothetical protein n=1 Tax=Nocardia sp. NPDC056000 TaxID=3345674 RepID=UPI0035DA5769